MSEPSKTERRLKSAAGETPDLKGVIGEQDPEDVDIFGYQIIYTTGDFTVPRDELLDKLDEVGLPEWMAPGKVSPHRRFTRAINDIAEDGEEVQFQGHRVRFEIEPGDNSQYTKHFHAKVFHSPEETQSNEGTWEDFELGVVRYNSEEKDIAFIDRMSEDSTFAPLWYDGIKNQAEARFRAHADLHIGDDVNNMTYYLCRTWTESVKLRQACYFIPAIYDGIEQYIDGFRELYAWLNSEHKHGGETTELFAINIMDSEREREMIERKVREELETEVSGVFDDLVSEIREGAAADEIAEEVVDDLDEIEGLAEQHSATLKTELSVKRAIRNVMQTMDEDREEVVDGVLAEAGLAPGVEA